MGCASSKSVTTTTAAVEVKPSTAVTKLAFKDTTQAAESDSSAFRIPAGPAATSAESAQALAVESCTATPRDDITAAAAPHNPAKQQPQDPEFDYEQELHNVPARPAAAAAAASSSYPAHPAGSSSTVGGLLSRQPNWLNEPSSNRDSGNNSNSHGLNPFFQAGGTKTAFAPVAVFSCSSSGATDAGQPAGASSSSNSASKGPSSLPPIGRGLGAAAIGSSSRGGALPPLSAGDSLQQSITAPTGPLAGMAAGVPASALAAAQGVELPTPRRLTGSLGSNKARDAPVNRRITGEAARTSGNGSSTAQHAVSSGLMADVDEGLDTQHADAAQQDYSQHGFNAQAINTVLSRNSSNTSASAAPLGNQAPAGTAADSASSSNYSSKAAPIDPSDPWSALQSQYVAAAGPASPDSLLAGSTTAAAAAAQRSGLAAGGPKRATRATKEAEELVLVDSDEYKSSSGHIYSEQVEQQESAAAAAAAASYGKLPKQGRAIQVESYEHSRGLNSDSSSSRLVAEGSRVMRAGQQPGGGQNGVTGYSSLTAESSRVKAGGWGTGSMAAAGTLMLGDEAEDSYSEDGGYAAAGGHGGAAASAAGVFAAQDDVFGADSPRAASVRQHGSNSARHNSTGAVQQQQQQHVAAAAAGVGHQEDEQMLGLQEIDDVDAMIEAELAAKNALPGDLAAKLATFEAMADDYE